METNVMFKLGWKDALMVAGMFSSVAGSYAVTTYKASQVEAQAKDIVSVKVDISALIESNKNLERAVENLRQDFREYFRRSR